jgi:Protein of unknown function (DUF3892)
MSSSIDRQVTCVVIESQRIVQIGGEGWQEKLSNVILQIGDHTQIYYTLVEGRRAEVEVVREEGETYLRSCEDGSTDNNLLSLPPCSKRLKTNI